MAEDVKYTNGWTLSISEDSWTCGDGCCTEYRYDLVLIDDNGNEVEKWEDLGYSPDSLITEIEADYGLVDVESV